MRQEKLSLLDMLYFIKESNRTKTSLKKLLTDKPGHLKDFLKCLGKRKKSTMKLNHILN